MSHIAALYCPVKLYVFCLIKRYNQAESDQRTYQELGNVAIA